MKRAVAIAPLSLFVAVTIAFAQPTKQGVSATAPSASSSAKSNPSATPSSSSTPTSSASTSPNTTAPITAHTRSSALETAGRDLAARFPALPSAMLVAGAAIRSDEPLHRGDELFARIISVVGGKFPNARVQREPTSLAQARALAGRSGGLLYLDVAIEKGKLHLVADVYPAVSNGWERLKQPLPEPSAHEFVEVPTDAELRGFLPPILLERATVHKLRVDDDVVAIACGDVDGDGSLDLVLATDKKISIGHAHGHRFVADKSVQIAQMSTRVATPLREPLAALLITNGRDEKLWVGNTDVGAFALDASLAKTKSTRKMPFSTERGVLCAAPDADFGTFIGALSPCDETEKSTREIPAPAAHYDAYAWMAVVQRSGASEDNVTAVREPGGKLRLSKNDAAHGESHVESVFEGVGAEIALGDLDQDGVVEVVNSLDGSDDAIVIQSWDGGEPRLRYRVAAPAGVHAIAICPPEDRGAPFVAAAVGSEVWLVR